MAAKSVKPRRGKAVRARTATPKPKPRPGRQPTHPLVVLYREGAQSVCAALIHPARPDTKISSAGGPHAALGALQDEGYAFGRIRNDVPDWALTRVPPNCKLIGCASITSVPFV